MVGRRRALAISVLLTAFGAASCARNPDTPPPAVEPTSGASDSSQQPSSEARAASQQAVPAYLRAACGHPGAQVRLLTIPITIPRDLCDLTGVVVRYGGIGVTVPSGGGVEGFADGISSSFELGANVDPITGDVTFQ